MAADSRHVTIFESSAKKIECTGSGICAIAKTMYFSFMYVTFICSLARPE
jgi:hypothetical protein